MKTIIPAQPGFFAKTEARVEPIIAWEIDNDYAYGTYIKVTPIGVFGLIDDRAVIFGPDGSEIDE